MNDILKKPYEISIWEDNIVTVNNVSRIEEKKLMVIGSDTMDSPNKVYEPVLTKNINGEVRLTFSLQYKYFDPVSELLVINPYSSFLINERKIKLHYDNEWYEFIIKNHTESSDGMKWTYECVDAFVLELSKTGYNLEFSPEINNNQGTVQELATAVLKDTDWTVDEATNAGKQKVEEPIYYATLNTNSGVKIINMDTNTEVSLSDNKLYVFYSYVANKNGKFVQFILRDGIQETDDKGNYIATNYRIEDELTYTEANNTITFDKGNTIVITISSLETQHHAYRLAYNQRTTYDPVMERTVDIFDAGNDREAYRYKDSVYSTSDVVVSYVSNGSDFEALDDGEIQGWSNFNDFTGDEPGLLEIAKEPNIDDKTSFKTLANYGGVRGFIVSKFNAAITENYENTIFNSGIEDSAAMIDSISMGQKFVFRWRGGKVYNRNNSLLPVPNGKIGCIVAKYTKEEKTVQSSGWHGFVNKFKSSDIILRFEGGEQILDNIIDNGVFETDSSNRKVRYLIDNVAQVPSTKYIYKAGENGEPYFWDNAETYFKKVSDDSNFLHYKYMVATAQQTIPNKVLTDPTTHIGIFIYLRSNASTDITRYYYFEDVQLTKYIEDANGQIVTLGNAPVATTFETDCYYLKPPVGSAAEDVETYTSVDAFAAGIGVPKDTIKPIYNEDSEKVLSINESNSNCFNILQSIAETFEAWLKIKVEHRSDGKIEKDNNGKPIKRILFSPFAGNDNDAGFKYGINLQSVDRTIESEEIVTKLVVDQAQSEYTDSGIVSIQAADANPSGESYILNFDYFYNQGLITDVATCKNDISNLNKDLHDINQQIKALEKERENLSMALTKINSSRNVYSECLDTAKDNLTTALAKFKEATGHDYSFYEGKETTVGNIYKKAQDDLGLEFDPEEKNYYIYKSEQDRYVQVKSPKKKYFYAYYLPIANIFDQDEIYSIIGEIYNSYSIINNYEGVFANIDKEYAEVREKLYGHPEYYFTATIVPIAATSNKYVLRIYVNDYVPGFHFKFNGTVYNTTANQKTFEFTLDTPTATISEIGLSGYKIYDSNKQEIPSAVTITTSQNYFTFTMKPTQPKEGKAEEIKRLQTEKDELNAEFFNKYSRFIQEGNWNSTDYIDSNLYYLDALQVSNNSAQPKVSYNISVVEISQIEGFEHYIFDVGDKTYIEDEEFFGWNSQFNRPAREEVIVSEVEWHLDEPDANSITVQNFKTQFEDLFQRLTATVQTVQYNEASYAKTSTLLDANGTLKQDVLVAALNEVSGRKHALTSDGSVYIDGDAIHIRNLTNPSNRVMINSEGIRISEDGGTSWTTAINGRGINIGEVFVGAIDTNKITIGGSKNPSFKWDKYGLSAYRRNPNVDYVLSEDTTVVSEKIYYQYSDELEGYERVINPQGNPHEQNYYELSPTGGEEYDLTTYVRYDENGLYGIKNNANFKPQSIDDIKENAHFAVTWDGFFIKNSYTGGGRVEITSDNDFRVLNTVDSHENEKIKIGALEWMVPADASEFSPTKDYYTWSGRAYELVENPQIDYIDSYFEKKMDPQSGIAPSLYGIRIRNNAGDEVMKTGDDGNITITGTIEALGGNFSERVTVGKNNDYTPNWIIIDGVNSAIKTSDYYDGAGTGWIINKSGDAVFNNITARGAIKTAVFEYAEIQAVGGIFLFRPSSTIKNARIATNQTDLIIEVEKPLIFTKIRYFLSEDETVQEGKTYYRRSNFGYEVIDNPTGNPHTQGYFEKAEPEYENSWCKVSNYISDTEPADSTVENILLTNGLTHVYKITHVDVSNKEVTLAGAAVMVEGEQAVTTLEELKGGALVDMGREDGSSNYGIGVNSSDNTVNLPRRAISLFETRIDEEAEEGLKVYYDYKGILGTLPVLQYEGQGAIVNKLYHDYMEDTQGIYTDNMYIGDTTQYLAFYTDKMDGKKKLKIKADSVEFSPPDGGDYINVSDGNIDVVISSNKGEIFKEVTTVRLTCTVYQYGRDITNKVVNFQWREDGYPIGTNSNIVDVETDFTSTAMYTCDVTM